MKVVELIRATYLIMLCADYKDGVADIVTFSPVNKITMRIKTEAVAQIWIPDLKSPVNCTFGACSGGTSKRMKLAMTHKSLRPSF